MINSLMINVITQVSNFKILPADYILRKTHFCISGCNFLGFEETKEASICKDSLNKLGTHGIINQGGIVTIFERTVNNNNY